MLKKFSQVSSENSNEFSAGNEISKLFQNIFPNLWVMLATLVAFILVLIVLYFLVYTPLRKSIQEKREFIQKNINETILRKENAIKLEMQKKEELQEANQKAFEIIENFKIKSEKDSEIYINNAKLEAKKIINSGNQVVEKMKYDYEKQYKKDVIETAVKLASKIIEKNINENDNEILINSFFNELSEHNE
ncbi:F0F1 ATP synthase subunit B [[Mycoplasma] collis]|uniref:F0F1 ATP synthase subunit B n=1 Tax=[Mycoplasma] collis TaxID=2127 RepID=UPI00051C16FC|nr:F0F1 ATP synthase subunit B [[Mycoplasma] collis]